MNTPQRLEEFFRRVQAAPPAASAPEALALVCRLIEEVEDEFCPVPRATPPPTFFTGRMYPPRGDYIWPQSDGRIVARARHHEIICFPNGEICIYYRPRSVLVLHKAGKNR